MASELNTLKAKFHIKSFSEIKWRYFGSHNVDPNNSVKHLSDEDKNTFRERLFKIITKRNSVKIIYSICNVAEAYKKPWINDQDDIYYETYKPLSERFQYFLQDISRDVGARQLGIVIADHQGRKQDDTLRNEHQRMVRRANIHTSDYKNYIETIFLTPSHHSVGIQFADMVAGAVSRKLNSGDRRWYDLISGSVRANAKGEIVGFGECRVPLR